MGRTEIERRQVLESPEFLQTGAPDVRAADPGMAEVERRQVCEGLEQRNVFIAKVAGDSKSDGHYGATGQLVIPLDLASQAFDFLDRVGFIRLV